MRKPLVLAQLLRQLRNQVQAEGGESAAVDSLLLGITGWSQIELLRNLRQPLPTETKGRLIKLTNQYLAGWPVQYLLQQAEFFGHEFYVDAAVLIPRPETEELVEWVLADTAARQPALRVADIGTGSGAIGISLKMARPNWQVVLSDISTAALKVAKKNATRLHADVTCCQGDLLAPLSGDFDLIISNPPYIAANEKKFMDKSVLEHEPQQALFAAENGLYFYRQLAQQVQKYLRPAGRLYLEIGFQQAARVKEIFLKSPAQVEVTVKKDLTGKDRMVRVVYMEE
ncbi:peptide chain release factor N(5)-glutamine methyltransferase [Liquorilactobacillus sicerae]|uniref:peptide chain release factor N(5)-glutamine methyltransferase n=1 Tax=Liquorilactobacillus sicerae TaxID=1416943 RepID=UPI00248174EF|nr:peptide chain release factor N(5)-glutamine methyltransferase [Liquorilactobacillus sicerae]